MTVKSQGLMPSKESYDYEYPVARFERADLEWLVSTLRRLPWDRERAKKMAEELAVSLKVEEE